MFNKAQPSRNLVFPYQAKSPTLKKVITYTEDELWNEVYRILGEDKERKFTPGTNLYYNLVLCADSSYFCTAETSFAMEEYMSMKRFNIPIARTIDEAEYERLVIFSAIDEEMTAISNENINKNNG
tara:strand:- start:2389 stop:2766 length:378 start_codon:yes stop_codon:yes gene_type:complete